MALCLRVTPIGALPGVAPAAAQSKNYAVNAGWTAYVETGSTSLPAEPAYVLVVDRSKPADALCDAVVQDGASFFAQTGSSGSSSTPMPPAYQELGNLSIANAEVITAYVGALWAFVWGIKQIVKALSNYEGLQNE